MNSKSFFTGCGVLLAIAATGLAHADTMECGGGIIDSDGRTA